MITAKKNNHKKSEVLLRNLDFITKNKGFMPYKERPVAQQNLTLINRLDNIISNPHKTLKYIVTEDKEIFRNNSISGKLKTKDEFSLERLDVTEPEKADTGNPEEFFKKVTSHILDSPVLKFVNPYIFEPPSGQHNPNQFSNVFYICRKLQETLRDNQLKEKRIEIYGRSYYFNKKGHFDENVDLEDLAKQLGSFKEFEKFSNVGIDIVFYLIDDRRLISEQGNEGVHTRYFATDRMIFICSEGAEGHKRGKQKRQSIERSDQSYESFAKKYSPSVADQTLEAIDLNYDP